MLGRSLLWASEKPSVKKLINEGKWGRSVVDRFVAGEDLEDAIQAIKELNSKKVGGILDLLGEGVADAQGVEAAVANYLAAIKRIDETGIDTTVSVKPTQLGISFRHAASQTSHLLAADLEQVLSLEQDLSADLRSLQVGKAQSR